MRTPAPRHILSLNVAVHVSSLTRTAAKPKHVLQFHYRSTSKHSKFIFPSTSIIGSKLQDEAVLPTASTQNVSLSSVCFPRDVSHHERDYENGPHGWNYSCSLPSHRQSGRGSSRSHRHHHLDKQAPKHGQRGRQSCIVTMLNEVHNAKRKYPFDSQGEKTQLSLAMPSRMTSMMLSFV